MAFRDALSLKRPLTMLYRMFFIILYSNKKPPIADFFTRVRNSGERRSDIFNPALFRLGNSLR